MKRHDIFFNIPNYSKPITFVSGGFVDDSDWTREYNDHDKKQVHNFVVVTNVQANDAN